MAVFPRILVAGVLIGLVQGPLPAHLRAWSPLLQLGDRDRPLSTAIVKVASLKRLAEAVTHNLELDSKTRLLFDNVSKNLETLDPASMYRMMESSPVERSRHAMSVFGELSPKGDYRVIARRNDRPTRFGDLAVTIAMKPAIGETFLLETDIAANLEVTADEMTGVGRGAMTWLKDTANAQGARAGAGLDDADRAVGREIASAFPAMAAMAERYFEPLDGVARSPSGVRGRIIGRLRQSAFAKDYPALAELLTDDVKAKARARVTAKDGRTLAMLKLDSGRGEVAVIFDVDPDRWISESYRVEADIDAELFGLHLSVEDVEVRTSVTQDQRGMVLRSIYNQTPKVDISGAALGIIPIALVDAVIPSNVKTIVGSFLGTLARTDGGQGARLEVTLPQDHSQPLRFNSRAELLNNGFVTFWLRIASAQVLGNDDVLEEMQHLQERALAAFSSDFARFQDQAM